MMMAVRTRALVKTGQGPRVTGQSMIALPRRARVRTPGERAPKRGWPEITRITALSPGRSFTIDGICFGERIGRMQLAGRAWQRRNAHLLEVD